MKSLSLRDFDPPSWAKNGHVQTILGHFMRNPKPLEQGRGVQIPLPDGDFLFGQVLEGSSPWVIYLFHGIGSNASVGYMVDTARTCLEMGHSVFLVNHRGCGPGGEFFSSKPYHAGRAEDLSEAIKLGRKLFPTKKHLAIGFSLSGNALLLLLARMRGFVLPDRAITVSAPLNLEASSVRLTQGMNRLYDQMFYYQCRSEVEARKKKGWIRKEVKIPFFGTIRELDAIYTAPQDGFKSREEYYQTCSSEFFLSQIQTPTIMLVAEDDPIVDFAAYQRASFSPSIRLHKTRHGGHMGFVSKDEMGSHGKNWMDYAISECLQALINSSATFIPEAN